ncbi:MAG: bifunctional glutamate N-acetyltransferase/amino-acid acetyltransferase ArgJ [Verrucomicrobia bacterium]|nr:bifunctional glutamate N-acetyltransferase/amino-acid acetyltransferase ArgJ [Verrucomicrobiota bacterium]MBU1735968.1 bifunctional glutamate N-acetyltransferase/amino-acid acetyltransferase ArgJ [Verrucomicrobiota bacterium]MBU1858067.1 bifunctional glutamate N-acetyltransferase/amino-acid acetyltransferase ArgJ [Verrucomicrobiota bacterium]
MVPGGVTTPGGITSPRGFQASGVAAGIKSDKRDMALLVSDTPAVIAGVFTTNRVQAAPVLLCRERLAARQARAIIINSGNANACTGTDGMRDARRMTQLTADLLQLAEPAVFVCSTGTIGRPLPMDKIEAGIRLAVKALAPAGAGAANAAGGADAATAIMTTDTKPKQIAAEVEIDGKLVTLGGMAKGAGMIHPNMATLLVFLTTDAAVEAVALQDCLATAVDRSFNRISVDGDRSTNDTVLFLANGAAQNATLDRRHPRWKAFCAAVNALTGELARQIVKDGEGATKLVTVTVRSAPGKRAAEKVARAVANSLLVKTSWFGADPNWGRVICAVGYAGVPVNPDQIDIAYNGQFAVRGGQPVGLAPEILHAIIAKPEFGIEIDLHLGRSTYTMTTCDCSDTYVHINASYMT